MLERVMSVAIDAGRTGSKVCVEYFAEKQAQQSPTSFKCDEITLTRDRDPSLQHS